MEIRGALIDFIRAHISFLCAHRELESVLMEFERAHIKLGLNPSARIESCRKPNFTAITAIMAISAASAKELTRYATLKGSLSARKAVL